MSEGAEDTGSKDTNVKDKAKDTNNNKKLEEPISKVKDAWMIRPCVVYDEEYSDCTSIKARLHQYFVFGETIDCSQWKRDSVNCYKWIDEKDSKAANDLVKSEKERRKQRLLPHYQNDIWQRRKQPPQDWNKPLPQYIEEGYETTYLNIKSKELKGEVPPSFDMNVPTFSCTIL